MRGNCNLGGGNRYFVFGRSFIVEIMIIITIILTEKKNATLKTNE